MQNKILIDSFEHHPDTTSALDSGKESNNHKQFVEISAAYDVGSAFMLNSSYFYSSAREIFFYN